MDEKLYLDQYDDGNLAGDLNEEQIEELQSLVGEALFNFNSLESALDRLIAEAVEERAYQPGYVITSELNAFAKKVLVFKALCGMMVHAFENKQLMEEFESLWKLLFKLKDFRNDIAHADWLEASSEYEVRLRIGTDEKGPYAIRKKMPPAFLEEKIDELIAAFEKIETFTEHRDEVMAYGRILTEEDYKKE